MKRKVLATLLSASMCVSLMPMMAFADATEYKVWVNGEQFTSDKLTIECGSGTATYNPTENELTLSDATITAGCYDGAIRVYDGIWSKGDLTIDMSGKLTIDAGDDYIFANYNLMVTGSGDIDITANTNGMFSSNGDVVLSGSGDIKVDAYNAIYSEDGNIDISGSGNLDLDAKEDAMNADKDIKLSGSGDIDVTLGSADDGIYSSGSIYISTSGELNINSRYGIFSYEGTVDISASGSIVIYGSYEGIYGNNGITISGSGDIIVKSSDNKAFGFNGNLILSGTGKVTGISESNDYSCVDIFSSDGAVLLNGKNTEVSFTSAEFANLCAGYGINV